MVAQFDEVLSIGEDDSGLTIITIRNIMLVKNST